jgi:hypothetical protein
LGPFEYIQVGVIPPVKIKKKQCLMGDARGMPWYAMEYPRLDEKNIIYIYIYTSIHVHHIV